ncbi:hypothetical protein V8E53_010911 [Lactarius tabidus]
MLNDTWTIATSLPYPFRPATYHHPPLLQLSLSWGLRKEQQTARSKRESLNMRDAGQTNGSCCCYNASKRSQAAQIADAPASEPQAEPHRERPSPDLLKRLLPVLRRLDWRGTINLPRRNLDVLIRHGLHILPETLHHD